MDFPQRPQPDDGPLSSRPSVGFEDLSLERELFGDIVEDDESTFITDLGLQDRTRASEDSEHQTRDPDDDDNDVDELGTSEVDPVVLEALRAELEHMSDDGLEGPSSLSLPPEQVQRILDGLVEALDDIDASIEEVKSARSVTFPAVYEMLPHDLPSDYIHALIADPSSWIWSTSLGPHLETLQVEDAAIDGNEGVLEEKGAELSHLLNENKELYQLLLRTRAAQLEAPLTTDMVVPGLEITPADPEQSGPKCEVTDSMGFSQTVVPGVVAAPPGSRQSSRSRSSMSARTSDLPKQAPDLYDERLYSLPPEDEELLARMLEEEAPTSAFLPDAAASAKLLHCDDMLQSEFGYDRDGLPPEIIGTEAALSSAVMSTSIGSTQITTGGQRDYLRERRLQKEQVSAMRGIELRISQLRSDPDTPVCEDRIKELVQQLKDTD